MLTFQQCGREHLRTLLPLAVKTFHDTFSHQNTPENMRAYMDEAFTEQRFLAELANPASRFFLAYMGEVLVGYLKINEAPAQTELNDARAIELERIYLLPGHQGKGLGLALLEQAVAIAKAAGKDYLWLGVWEKNEKALAFYRRNGFVVFDRHTFVMGDDRQTDFLMRKEL